MTRAPGVGPAPAEVRPPSGAWRRWGRAGAGYLFALACLVWVFHDFRLRDLRAALLGVRWGWVPLAIACDVASYVSQGWRWSLLLRPLGRVSALRATAAVYAGLFVNELLPMRPGEWLRAYLVSRRTGAGISRVIPSIMVERLLDSVWVALALALVALFVPLPAGLVHAGEALGVLVLLGTALFVFAIVRPAGAVHEMPAGAAHEMPAGAVQAMPAGGGWRSRLRRMLLRQAEGLRGIGLSARLLEATLLTAALLVLQGLAFWLVLLACRVHLPVWAGLAVFLIVHFGTAVPNAPGNMGSYQFFCVLGLALFGVAKPVAATFSIVVFVLLTIPLWALGYLALHGAGLGLRAVREDVRGWQARSGDSGS